MVKVITYGTYDLLHYGHIRLLERAKALGDYLIVGVTSDDYDKTRGKINNRQPLMERVAAVEATGIPDEVIVEEYEGQKIDDIRRYGADIFTVGSDWEGYFDYLKEYCTVIYLPRTEGISSSEIRSSRNRLRIGLLMDNGAELTSAQKFIQEIPYVNGVEIAAICGGSSAPGSDIPSIGIYSELLDAVDAVYITSHPVQHSRQVREALEKEKHILCESPIALSGEECRDLFALAKRNGLILMDGIKTAYSTAYSRLLLLLKAGKIGEVVSVDATCTSLKNVECYNSEQLTHNWNTITEWGPLALLPVFQILGVQYRDVKITSRVLEENRFFDVFSKIDFTFEHAVASVKVGKSVKSEGELIVSGTKGYAIVPAPWWKTDYFEIRYENPAENRRYFYQLDGEGIRYEIAAFTRAIESGRTDFLISDIVSQKICEILQNFYSNKVTYL